MSDNNVDTVEPNLFLVSLGKRIYFPISDRGRLLVIFDRDAIVRPVHKLPTADYLAVLRPLLH